MSFSTFLHHDDLLTSSDHRSGNILKDLIAHPCPIPGVPLAVQMAMERTGELDDMYGEHECSDCEECLEGIHCANCDEADLFALVRTPKRKRVGNRCRDRATAERELRMKTPKQMRADYRMSSEAFYKLVSHLDQYV